jgi:predicted DNA-binding protein with PD1-like motif
MQSKMLKDAREAGHIYVLVFEIGDSVIETITSFARENGIGAAHFTAIGAFSDATIAVFDFATKGYKNIPVDEQVEVASLVGNITLSNGEPIVHAHVTLGRQDGSTFGGHLIEARVRPTLELFLTRLPQSLQRKLTKESNLPLIHIATDL